MPKPTETPPSSDIEGVHRDRRDNVDAAIEAGQDGADLKRAHNQSAGRPNYAKERSRDDR